jgi:serine/threonine protein kinase
MSPELFSMKKTYSYSADVWALGCIIFNLSTGIPPFFEIDREA